MEFLSILAIAVGLSADCFAVAVSTGISQNGHSRAGMLRLSSSFGMFQAVMPVLGWLLGRTIAGYVSGYDHWVAFGLLAFVGGRMLWEAFHSEGEGSGKTDVTRGLPLLLVSVATSIDALAVGLSFAFIGVNMLRTSLTIGVTAFVITVTGFMIGRKANRWAAKRAEIVGGSILIVIGLRILLSHIL